VKRSISGSQQDDDRSSNALYESSCKRTAFYMDHTVLVLKDSFWPAPTIRTVDLTKLDQQPSSELWESGKRGFSPGSSMGQFAWKLRRMFPQASKKMLTQHLREMERDGLVIRKGSGANFLRMSDG
jgi:hypothetical protein